MQILSKGTCRTALGFFWIGLGAAFMAGCGPTPVAIPKFDPDAIAARAMEMYDKNKDGRLDAAELERCPALKHALKQIDPEKLDLTEEDLVKRLTIFQKSGVGIMGVRCTVMGGAGPVKDVTVTYVPEAFMADVIKPASGVSDEEGIVHLKVAGEPVNGVNLGYYRIEASLKDASGNETLPAEFNKDSKMGQEVAPLRSVFYQITLSP